MCRQSHFKECGNLERLVFTALRRISPDIFRRRCKIGREVDFIVQNMINTKDRKGLGWCRSVNPLDNKEQ